MLSVEAQSRRVQDQTVAFRCSWVSRKVPFHVLDLNASTLSAMRAATSFSSTTFSPPMRSMMCWRRSVLSATVGGKDKYLALEQHIAEQATLVLWCDSDHQLAAGLARAQSRRSRRNS